MLGVRYPQMPGMVFLALVLFTAGAPVRAADLVAVYRMAQRNDPRFNAARHEYLAAREALPQAKATYRPTVTLRAETGHTRQQILRSDTEVYGVGKSNFPTRSYSLEVTQPIINVPGLAQISRARAEVRQAGADYASARQELVLRVATAYLGVLAATTDARLAGDEKRAAKRRLTMASRRLETGFGTVTDLHETKARFEFAAARVTEAHNALEDSFEALRESTGLQVKHLVLLRGDIPLTVPHPADVKVWIAVALAGNPKLKARRLALRAARAEIRRQVGRRYPTLDLVGTHERRDAGGSLFGGGSDVETSDVTLRLAVPLYAGGATAAQVRAARYRYGKALDELELQQRLVRRQTRAAFLDVIGGISKVKALRESVVAQQLTLKAKEKGFEAGINTNLEVLDALRDLFAAKRDYAHARYDYLLSLLRLKQAAGALKPADLVAVNRVLAGGATPADLTPSIERPAPVAGAPRVVAIHNQTSAQAPD